MKARKTIILLVSISILAYLYLFKMQNAMFKEFEVDKKVINEIIANNITDSMSEYEKVRAIHDYIIISTKYDEENLKKDTIPDIDFTAKGVLEEHLAVCRGYAEAFKLLMDELDIDCEIVTGYADSVSHAWNVVNVDGAWYQIDCTYDDPVDENNTAGNGDNLRYDYFLVTDEQICLDHTPDELKYDCNSEKYMYQEKMRDVPFVILNSIQMLPGILLENIDKNITSMTFYFPENIDLETSRIIERLSILLGNTGHSFTQFYYTPVQKCGKYYYTSFFVE